MMNDVEVEVEHITNAVENLSLLPNQEEQSQESENGYGNHSGVCAICLDTIKLQDIALVKDCEHAYCVSCILQWATYTKTPTCPQCKHPFDFLNVHRSLDGSIQDYMFEESVCLLLRAQWFTPLVVEHENVYGHDADDYFPYEEEYCDDDDDDDIDEAYFSNSSSVRIGNRRWGDNGYVRGGRQQARPIGRPNFQDPGAGSSSQPRPKDSPKDKTGRRAKRALKREAADKAAAAKHEQHLARFSRN